MQSQNPSHYREKTRRVVDGKKRKLVQLPQPRGRRPGGALLGIPGNLRYFGRWGPKYLAEKTFWAHRCEFAARDDDARYRPTDIEQELNIMYKIRGRITPLAFYDGCDCEARVAFFADGNYYLWFPGAGALFRLMMEFAEFQKLSMLWVDDLDQEDISGGLPLSPALLNQSIHRAVIWAAPVRVSFAPTGTAKTVYLLNGPVTGRIGRVSANSSLKRPAAGGDYYYADGFGELYRYEDHFESHADFLARVERAPRVKVPEIRAWSDREYQIKSEQQALRTVDWCRLEPVI
ncbi:hypothetical protein B0H13DRAFT_1863141 [Mycena leptocephala]|nr:hypothetical protein B0H13DRAFT_1863141 [Mycena leptocephala]